MKIEYNNLYTHLIFVTFKRQKLISENNRVRIEKYITGIVSNTASKLYAIYANPDHLHFLVSRSHQISEAQLATLIADSSERFINDNQLCEVEFIWQQSASAFSVSKSDINKVCNYILNQEEHHKKFTFEEEYEKFVRHYQGTLDNKSKDR